MFMYVLYVCMEGGEGKWYSLAIAPEGKLVIVNILAICNAPVFFSTISFIALA